jgi:hypothetical protein
VNQPPDLPSDYHSIEPLPNFRVEQEEPPKIYVFKPKYFLTLGLQKASFSEYLPLDRTLVDRLTLRRKIVSEHKQVVLGALPDSLPAVSEYHKWLIGDYLPDCYPTVYKRSPAVLTDNEIKRFTTCSTNGTSIPLEPPSDPEDVLRILAESVDTELFFLKAEYYGD